MSETSATSVTTTGNQAVPVLPLRDVVVYPHMVIPLFVGREKSVRALEDVMKDDKQILLVTQKNAAQDAPSIEDIYRVGTVSTILQLLKLPDGTVKVLVEGGRRARLTGFKETEAYFEAFVEEMAEPVSEPRELEALGRTVVTQFEQYIKLNKKIAPEVLVSLNQIDVASKLADTVASRELLSGGNEERVVGVARDLLERGDLEQQGYVEPVAGRQHHDFARLAGELGERGLGAQRR